MATPQYRHGRFQRLRHGMLLDAKAMPELASIKDLIPGILHERFDRIIRRFEDTLCSADVGDQYEEREGIGEWLR